MFKNKLRALRVEKEQLEKSVNDLRKELGVLKTDHKNQIRQMEHERKVSDEDIKHMVKMKTEALEIKAQKEQNEREAEKNKEVMAVKMEYQTKVEGLLHSEIDRLRAMYGEILNRLPNVNMEITESRGKK